MAGEMIHDRCPRRWHHRRCDRTALPDLPGAQEAEPMRPRPIDPVDSAWLALSRYATPCPPGIGEAPDLNGVAPIAASALARERPCLRHLPRWILMSGKALRSPSRASPTSIVTGAPCAATTSSRAWGATFARANRPWASVGTR